MGWFTRKQPILLAERPGATRSDVVPFEAACAPAVARWVQSSDELFWLAPKTPPRLTAKKVLDWQHPEGQSVLYWPAPEDGPSGYAELNPMPAQTRHWWIGHCIVAPERRGEGIGYRLVEQLLADAFGHHHAYRVSLVVFPDNVLAIRCYNRAGFTCRGQMLRQFATRPGEYPMTYMAIDRGEYRGRPLRQNAQDLRGPR
ncbi:MAG: GNAT family N-acetyltransferase [Phycisphaerae bacterium]|nr:GNAT family N-acetyltransferase [Phycisphaerae bacterium]